MEWNVSKIQRSQKPTAEEEYESRKWDDGDQEDKYTERVGEGAQTDFDEENSIISLEETKDGDEVVVMEYKATEVDFAEFQGIRNYTSASFALI